MILLNYSKWSKNNNWWSNVEKWILYSVIKERWKHHEKTFFIMVKVYLKTRFLSFFFNWTISRSFIYPSLNNFSKNFKKICFKITLFLSYLTFFNISAVKVAYFFLRKEGPSSSKVTCLQFWIEGRVIFSTFY